jgi:hypothetical protein
MIEGREPVTGELLTGQQAAQFARQAQQNGRDFVGDNGPRQRQIDAVTFADSSRQTAADDKPTNRRLLVLTQCLHARQQRFVEIAAEALFRTHQYAEFPPWQRFVDKLGVSGQKIGGGRFDP